MKKILHKLLIPFAIIHIRIIQWRYKRISVNRKWAQSNSNIAKLKLLQVKEEYYKDQFESWGMFNPRFSYTKGEMIEHIEFMDWLFPKKDFEEWEVVVRCKREAVTLYRNIIYTLGEGKEVSKKEILDQIERWDKERKRYYNLPT